MQKRISEETIQAVGLQQQTTTLAAPDSYEQVTEATICIGSLNRRLAGVKSYLARQVLIAYCAIQATGGENLV